MLRWSILIVTLVVWLVCMNSVYMKFSPQVSRNTVTANTTSLENLFDENGEVSMSWDVFVRPAELNDSNLMPFSGMDPRVGAASKPKGVPHVDWTGVDETGLAHVGRLEAHVRRKFTRVEQTASVNLQIPEQIHVTDVLRHIRAETRADYSLDQGLEYCNAKISIGELFDAYALGLRSGSEMFITNDISFEGKQAYHSTDKLAIGDRAAPSVDVMLFQRNKDVQVGASWDIVQLDLSSVDMSSPSEAKMISTKVTCTGKKQINYRGSKVMVFEVQSEDGTARAWYSADGVVLKQTFKFLGLFDVFFVRTGATRVLRGGPNPTDGD